MNRHWNQLLRIIKVLPAPCLAAALCSGLAAAAEPATTRPASEAAAAATQPVRSIRVSGDRVHLRSRPDRNSLPVARVNEDTVLAVRGARYGWYEVVPPDGVYSQVAARYVDRIAPDKGVVSVRSGRLRVRVGSTLHADRDPLRNEVQTLLPRGAEVQVLKDAGDWLHIAPPPGVHVYISGRYAEPVSAARAAELRQRVASTQPAGAEDDAAAEADPAPDLSGPWGQRLVLVEAEIAAEERRPTLQQSWTRAIAQLRPIAAQREDPAVARLAAAWIERLEQRMVQQAALRQTEALAEQARQREAQFERELERLRRMRQGLRENETELRGQFLPSFALRSEAGHPRWKLEDPLTHAVVAYVTIADDSTIDPAAFLGRYVGVQGEVREETEFGAPVIAARVIETRSRTSATRPTRQDD